MTAPTFHRPFVRALGAALLGASAFAAQAASFTTAGHLVFDTDVVRIDFTLAAASPVTVWTDSWQAGLNFDPTLSLFDAGGRLLATGDDTPDLAVAHAGQGGYDSQISVASLAAGRYFLSLSASGNDPLGTTYAAGFALQGTAPIRIADWNQPSYDLNKNDQKGSAWEVRLDGPTTAGITVPAVPEPGQWALLLVGLIAVGGGARGRQRRG